MKPVRKGQPIRGSLKAADWNTFRRTSRAQLEGKLNQRRQRPLPENKDRDVVWVENTTGGDLDQFDIVGLAGVTFTEDENESEFKRQPTLTAVTPTKPTYSGRFGVLQQPIKDGGIGQAVISGWTLARVNVASTSHQYADITHNDPTKLTSGTGGSARILNAPGSEGTKLVVVRLSNLPPAAIGYATVLTTSSDTTLSGTNGSVNVNFTSVQHGSSSSLPIYGQSSDDKIYVAGAARLIELAGMVLIRGDDFNTTGDFRNDNFYLSIIGNHSAFLDRVTVSRTTPEWHKPNFGLRGTTHPVTSAGNYQLQVGWNINSGCSYSLELARFAGYDLSNFNQ